MHRSRSLLTAPLLGAAFVLTLATAGCAGSSSGSFVGTWGDADSDSAPSLVIEEGGAFSGTDGCNRLAGTATFDGDTIDFGDTASTLMACEGVDTWLSGLDTGTVVDGALQISDEGGAVIGSLPKQ
ncbi:META domain-containing protein [Leucobacter celer]|uniref:META domain-containing protein n=1 Tax=Leucobacter celer TaxID=668625 RepID=UPI0006A7A593|nr:META domain-containing protein [Leucobacter celer]